MDLGRVKIRTALGAALLVGLLLPASITSWYGITRQRQRMSDELSRFHARATRVLAQGMQQPLWTMVPGLGKPLLDSVMADERIIRVCVTDESGVFLEQEQVERRSGTSLSLVEPVVYDEETIGQVEVEIATGRMETALAHQKAGLLLLTVVQLLVSLLIIFLILRFKVLQPLQLLVRQSEKLARRELQEPFSWQGSDELCLLGQSFESTRRSLQELFSELEQKNRELQNLNRGLHEALAARSIFLANMSHELRTPLNSIIGFAGILDRKLEGKVNPRQHKFLQNIHSSGTQLLGVINDVLDLAKIEAGQMQCLVEPVDVGRALEGIWYLLLRGATRKLITIELLVPDDLPPAMTDQAKLKQIAYHLLSNAIKFSPESSTVTIKASRAEAGASPLKTTCLRIDVRDFGIGIAPEHRQIIFEEFRQLDTGPDRRYEGTGLGLALVRHLVKLLQGRIEVESEIGKGSTFTVFLPQPEWQASRESGVESRESPHPKTEPVQA